MATISVLPDELLVQITSYFQGKLRKRDLLSLSLTCRKLRECAREGLLCSPSLRLQDITAYLLQIYNYPHFAPMIQTLELFSSSEGFTSNGLIYPRASIPAEQVKNNVLVESWAQILERYVPGKVAQWRLDLEGDAFLALTSVLLLALPNLKELYVGATWLVHFPIFSGMVTHEVTRSEPLEWGSPSSYTSEVLNILRPKLEVLDFPVDLQGMKFSRGSCKLFDFRGFTNLRELGITMYALHHHDFLRQPPTDPHAILPPSLQRLKISECSRATPNFMHAISLAKKAGHLPNLTRVELFYLRPFAPIQFCCQVTLSPDPVEDMKTILRGSGISVYVYFPTVRLFTADIRDTPWKWKEAGALSEAEEMAYSEQWIDRMGVPGFFEQECNPAEAQSAKPKSGMS